MKPIHVTTQDQPTKLRRRPVSASSSHRAYTPRPPIVSVIIPVHSDPRLANCLSALALQDLPDADFEILVVDNATEPDPRTALIVRQFDGVCLLHEPHPGSYAARNAGLRSARGEIVAFTDADCLPASDWLRRGIEALRSEPNCGLIGGLVELTVQNPSHPTAVELYERCFALNQQLYVERRNYSATANLFAFRSTFDRVGPFDLRLKSSGDKEWGQRVARHGYRAAFVETVRVQHPARRTLRELLRKAVRIVGGARDLSVMRPSHTSAAPSLVRRLANRIESVFRHRDLVRRRDRFRVSLIVLCLGATQIVEQLRLRLGGRSRR